MNNTTVITKPLGVKSELRTALNENSSALNEAKGCLESKNCGDAKTDEAIANSRHLETEGEAAVPVTDGVRKSTEDTSTAANTTYDFKLPLQKEGTTVNTTFEFKCPAGKENPAANSTFTRKETPANTTFECQKGPVGRGNTQANTTFVWTEPAGEQQTDATFNTGNLKGKEQGDRGSECVKLIMENKGANETFDTENKTRATQQTDVAYECSKPANNQANTTFDAVTKGGIHHPSANTTFEYHRDKEAPNTTFTTEHTEPPPKELNVTFEKGEYRIGDHNETVNLMDAEENVLQVILDATPKKVSHRDPRAASTPKSSGNHHQPHLKAGVSYRFL